RAFAQGAIWMCARLGGAFAPKLIGLLSAALGWRQAFWVLGAAGVSWCVVFWVWFRDTPEEMPGCNEAERDLIRSRSRPAAGISLDPVFPKAVAPADTDSIQVGAASRAGPVRLDPPD